MALDGQDRPLELPGREGGKTDRRVFTAAHCCLYFTLGFVMACARVLEDGAPFGMALAAAAGPSVSGVSALLGAALGYLGGGLEWGVRYVAASVLVYTVAFVFHELPIYWRPFFMPAVAGLVMAVTAWLGGYTQAKDLLGLLSALFLESLLAFGGTYFFREALAGGGEGTEGGELRHGAAVMILLSCLLMTLSRLVVFDTVSVGRVLALILVMASAMKSGMLSGAAVGTVLGLAMDAPVLTRADVGIAMGALGSDAAIESADIVLMDDKPSRLPLAMRIARKTMRIVRQNIVLALGVKILILILGALGLANMWLAVFGDVGVLILAILNALRCMKAE